MKKENDEGHNVLEKVNNNEMSNDHEHSLQAHKANAKCAGMISLLKINS